MVVVGLGGVGSHCAHALLRGVLPGGSVRRLRLIDFDRVSLSSLNRHAVALRRDAPWSGFYLMMIGPLDLEFQKVM